MDNPSILRGKVKNVTYMETSESLNTKEIKDLISILQSDEGEKIMSYADQLCFRKVII